MHHVAKNDCLPCLSILVKTKSLTTLRLCDIHIFQYIVALHLIDPRVYRIGLPLVQKYSLCGDDAFWNWQVHPFIA